jgi:hypothetical protein
MPVTTRPPESVASTELDGIVVRRKRTPVPATALVGALLALVTFAAFAHGATHVRSEGPLQAGLALVFVIAAAVWLWHGSLPLSAPAAAWAGFALLAAFAVWTGITLAWSVAPDRTWIELNRSIAYVLVVLLAFAAGSWHTRALEQVAIGYLCVAVVVALYALGGKIAPGVHLDGLINLNQTSVVPRLRAPVQYWNALAMLMVLAVPPALRVAVDEARALAPRLAALLGLCIVLVALGLTYSRGGVLALVVCLAVLLALTGPRLRMLLVFALALAGAVAPLAYAFSHHSLTGGLVPLSKRERPGLVLGVILLASLVALAFAARAVFASERRVVLSPQGARKIALALVVAAALALVGGTVAVAASHRGLTGSISHQWHSFTRAKGDQAALNPAHLLSVNSSNRWVWWEEAIGAWSDRPLRGWGAGSFPVLHLQYRKNGLNVRQPHSVPLQFLAETGAVGALLAMGGLVALLVGAIAVVRRTTEPAGRGMTAALTAGAAAWLVHGLYEWDWDFPAVLIPGLVLLGVVAGSGGVRQSAALLAGRSARATALAATGVVMSAVAISALLPAWSDWKTAQAIDRSGPNASNARLQQAADDAELAGRLNPLADEPLLVAASIAERRGDARYARRQLLRAIAREPKSVGARYQLAGFDATRLNLNALRRTLAIAVKLDPKGTTALRVASNVASAVALPNNSATATGTPLPFGPLAFR